MKYTLPVSAALLSLSICASNASEVDIHGFLSQGYIYSQDNNYLSPDSTTGTFEYNEFGINFGTDVTSDLRIGAQLFARDLGDWSNNNLILDWAYGDYYIQDSFSIRAGKVKYAMGLYQEVQDFDFLRTWAILPTGVYDPSWRVFGSTINGIQLYGTVESNSFGSIGYQFTVGDNQIDGDQDIERLVVGNGSAQTVDDADINGQVVFHVDYQTPIDGLHVVGSFMIVDGLEADVTALAPASDIVGPTGNPVLDEALIKLNVVVDYARYNVMHLGVEYVRDSLTLAAEYRRNFIIEETTNNTPFGSSVSSVTSNSDGLYVGGGYRLNDNWSIGSYLSYFWPDAHDRKGDDYNNVDEHRAWRRDFAFSLQYDVNESWLIKGEAHLVNGTGGIGSYNPGVASADLEEDWSYFVVKTTFNF